MSTTRETTQEVKLLPEKKFGETVKRMDSQFSAFSAGYGSQTSRKKMRSRQYMKHRRAVFRFLDFGNENRTNESIYYETAA